MTREEKPKLIIPEGWECIGYQIPKKGMGYIPESASRNFEIAPFDFNPNAPVIKLCFRKVETVDHELEEAKKRFPIGSWVTVNLDKYLGHILPVTSVENRGFGIDVWSGKGDYAIPFPLDRCTPFPIPRWRCCETDKPKKDGIYYTRVKFTHVQRDFDEFCGENWESICPKYVSISDYEWLDEGGAE